MRAFEEAAGLLHLAFDRLELFGVDEHFEIAGVGEVDLGGQQRRAGDPLVAGRRHGAERGRQQRAADAIADRRDVAFAGRLLDRVERREHAFAHIGLEALAWRGACRD